MIQAVFLFPKGFLWGTATAAHQVEGRNENNTWRLWEEEPDRIHNGEKAGLACDWWGGRWREDLDRAAKAGQNAHRLSVEWSRVQPAPDRWDEGALDFYRQILRELVNRGMTPVVTLHHFTDPIWFAEKGGWESDDSPALFSVYANKTVEALKEYCNLWVTINEPNVYVSGGYLGGGFPPGKNNLKTAFGVFANLLRGHASAYRGIHKVQPTARVGVAHHVRGFEPARPWFPADRWIVNVLHANFNNAFPGALQDGRFRFAFRSMSVPEASGAQDFFGLNYYTAEQAAFAPFAKDDFFAKRFFPHGADLSPTGFIANRPDAFYKAMRWAERFKLPIVITENGVEDAQDTLRPRYLLQHVHQVWRALNNSWPIKGYFHWSLIDNFEWERGWGQRFGLWGLDRETRARIHRKSVDLYAAICKENGISSEMTEKYAPEVFSKLFPE
ncbi:MAG: glycoside hydrolase family 1 protein [Anaerolineaceae bacterium]|nr:glycoside hydrolase family 1 protein [Anaerolineaceae bacterium]